ncbi:hypothetical protein [Silvibacterium sp.]|uniref:hypothetical protein n=1 Tax=Silvibacterium sp. TaxID=1964179 RepID=UPI0039E25422
MSHAVMEQEPEHQPESATHASFGGAVPERISLRDGGDLNDDGTRQLLRAGIGILATGTLAALLTVSILGGIGPQGPHSSAGWLALMVALMCWPFGSLCFLLGFAKWLRNRHIAKHGDTGRNRR